MSEWVDVTETQMNPPRSIGGRSSWRPKAAQQSAADARKKKALIVSDSAQEWWWGIVVGMCHFPFARCELVIESFWMNLMQVYRMSRYVSSLVCSFELMIAYKQQHNQLEMSPAKAREEGSPLWANLASASVWFGTSPAHVTKKLLGGSIDCLFTSKNGRCYASFDIQAMLRNTLCH